jgi:SAM-dependent methyltransferase
LNRDRDKDRVFSERLGNVKPFEFNETVANVFQDMISRSVPGYELLLRMIGLYAGIFVQPGSRVFDLGCSLGEASLVIAEQAHARDCEIVAVDNSSAMIAKCNQHELLPKNIEWRCQDIRQTEISNASMVVLNLTLQFLPPAERQNLLERIFQGLNLKMLLKTNAWWNYTRALRKPWATATSKSARNVTRLKMFWFPTPNHSTLKDSRRLDSMKSTSVSGVSILFLTWQSKSELGRFIRLLAPSRSKSMGATTRGGKQ